MFLLDFLVWTLFFWYNKPRPFVMRKVILLFQSAYINLVCFIRDGKKKRCGKKVANAHKKGLRKVAGVKTEREKKKK